MQDVFQTTNEQKARLKTFLPLRASSDRITFSTARSKGTKAINSKIEV